MKTMMITTVLAGLLGGAMFVQADGGRHERHQQRLMERFGEEGIDANDDGKLTREEIHSFMMENEIAPPHGREGLGRHFRPGKGFHGKGRDGSRGHAGRGMRMLKRLEVLESETAPEGFALERHPDADTDGDGELSNEEWTVFSGAKRTEILERLLKRLPGIDANGNKVVDADELSGFKAMHEQRAREDLLLRHPDADTDADGQVSTAEFEAFRAERRETHRARVLERHPELDVDEDGVLSDDEMRELRRDRGLRRGLHRGHGKQGQGGRFRGKRAMERQTTPL